MHEGASVARVALQRDGLALHVEYVAIDLVYLALQFAALALELGHDARILTTLKLLVDVRHRSRHHGRLSLKETVLAMLLVRAVDKGARRELNEDSPVEDAVTVHAIGIVRSAEYVPLETGLATDILAVQTLGATRRRDLFDADGTLIRHSPARGNLHGRGPDRQQI